MVALSVGVAFGAHESVVKAVRTATPPVIDGLLEDVWRLAAPATAFRQFRPSLNQPASGETHVYLLYDDRALYVGWVCEEDYPERLVAAATVRDMSMNEDDCVDFMWDANNDRQTAYDFMVNYRGIRYDGTIAKDGTAGGPAWDGQWEAATSVDENAWYCEMAIPWETVRYDRRTGSFGVQFLRIRRAVYEESYWAGDGQLINRVSTFGKAVGFENLPRPKPWEIIPYVTARGEGVPAPATGDSDRRFVPRYGGDLEYRPGAAMSALVTFLPDYAYVESDPATINLTPSETWLEEKRPFFTEGAELFDTGNDIVYTRRLTEVAAGGKAAGRVGSLNYGVFDVKLTDDDPRFPGDNFYAGRVSLDFADGSTLGAVAVGRQEFAGEASPRAPDSAKYNFVGHCDGHIILPAKFSWGFEGARSVTDGEAGDGYMYSAGLWRGGLTNNAGAWFSEYSRDFRADMGYVLPEELACREVGGEALEEWQINRAGVRALRFYGHYSHNWNLEGETTYNFVSPVLRAAAINDFFLTFNYRGGRDYRYVQWNYPVFHNRVWDIAAGHLPAFWGDFRVGYWRGEWYGDFYHYYTVEASAVPLRSVMIEGNVDVGNRRSDRRRFGASNIKVTYNIADNLYARLILQGDSLDEEAAAGVLWGWNYRRGSVIYIAYEQHRDLSGHFLLADQTAFVKVTYSFQM